MTDDSDATVGLILARAGSKRVPNKNTRLLDGRPLIAYTVDAAITAACFSSIVVSTDDARVAEIARESGVSVDKRPASLCGDTVRAVEVVEEYLQRTDAGSRFSNVAMLLPTCPFRTVEDIRGAMRLYKQSAQRMPLITVTQYAFPPQLALAPGDQESDDEQDDRESGQMCMCQPEAYATTTRSQSIAPLYHPNGGLYVAAIDLFLNERSFFTERMLTYVMPAERSFDIDYPWQFDLAEHWARQVHAVETRGGATS
jgi:CMP-N-acetylneuraminic acid synthetase